MKVLLVGAWGREHALAEKYSKSKRVEKVFVVPGNGLMDFQNKKIVTAPHVNAYNIEEVLAFVKKNKIDFADISPEDFLALGFVDKLRKAGVKVFGPTQKAARIESSKEWARDFMEKYNLPIPHFKSFHNQKDAISYVNKLPEQLLYIKASGLCGGKGAVRAEGKKEAQEAIASMSEFGKAGETFLIEEGMVGEEFSFFVICDGITYIVSKNAQDHKTVFNADKGLNTGGMGCVSPVKAVTPKIIKEVEKNIIKPFLHGMKKEKELFQGILYIGGMLTKKGVKIIEFNARWGSPEAEVILPSIQTDYMQLAEAVVNQTLSKIKIKFDKKIRISICGAASGYPGDYSFAKGKEIFGLTDAMRLPGIRIYGAGLKRKDKPASPAGGRFFVDGGRLFHLVAEGKDIIDARKKAYAAMSMIYIEGNNLHYRTDIGWRELQRIVK